MARDIKDELQGGSEPTPPEPAPQQAEGSLQVPFDFQQQRILTQVVLEDFRSAENARNERDYGTDSKGGHRDFDSWLKELKDLYFGRREPKTIPWKYCSNRSLMIAMSIVETLHARLFPACWNEELLHFRPTEVGDKEKAERIEKLMHWWMRVHVRYREFVDRWCRHVIGYGRAVTETVWDVQRVDKGETQESPPQMDEMGQPIPSAPSKVIERIEKTKSFLIPEEDIFLLDGSTDIQRDPVILRKKFLFRELEEMEAQGTLVNITLPSVPGSDTLKDKLPVPEMSAPAGATPEQVEELKRVKLRNVPVTILQEMVGIDMDSDGFPEQLKIVVHQEYQMYLGAIDLSGLSKRGIRHLDLTQFMPRLDEPEGLRGYGALEQVKELALEIDAIFNQMTDANTLSVLRPFFYDPGGDIDVPNMKFQPNKGIPISNPSQAVFVPEFNVRTEQLINAVRMCMEFIERLTAASAYVMGKESEIVGGSGTATRTEAIVGAADQRHSVPTERLREGVVRLVNQHLDLLQVNLPPGLEDRILNDEHDPLFEPNALSQQAISGEFDAYLLPDDSFGSKETQRQLSQMIYQTLTQNILVASDPIKLYTLTADWLKAWGKDPELFLGPAPENTFVDTPAEENMLVLQGDMSQVRASVMDNHIQHIMEHQAFLQDPAFLALAPELQQQIGQFLQQHIQEHTQMMGMMMQAAQSAGQKKGSGQNGGGLQGNVQNGGAQTSAPVGPEPGVGSAQDPMAAARSAQGTGESAVPS